MPIIPIHTSASSPTRPTNPLPTLLQTPSGLALVEIQGTIHAPFSSPSSDSISAEPTKTHIGRLEFPLYDSASKDDDGKWMKKVYLYVGKHQRLTGEVKKLPKAVAVLKKRECEDDEVMRDIDSGAPGEDGIGEELEIAEIVRWKILFAGRPEPVGGDKE